MKNKVILLTGGTGFLGSNLARRFLDEGHKVIALKRSTSNLSRLKLLLEQLVIYDVDLVDLDAIFLKHPQIDTIVHCSCNYGRNIFDPYELVNDNLRFPLKLLSLSSSNGVTEFINVTTSLPPMVNEYALSKAQFSEWGAYFANKGLIKFINVKLEHMYGPNDGDNKFITHIIRAMLKNEPEVKLTAGEQLRDFIYITDVVEAFSLLVNVEDISSSFVEYEIGSGRAIKIKDVVKLIKSLTNSKSKLLFGKIPYRKAESMILESDNQLINGLGWGCKVPLKEGLIRTINSELHLLGDTICVD